MTDYSTYHRVMSWEADAFDAGKPTSVHRLQQLFEQSNHLLDSQLQTRVSFASPGAIGGVGAGWPPPPTAVIHNGFRLLFSWTVPWRVLTYGASAPALARPIVMAAGSMLDANEYVTSVEIGVTMQPDAAAPKNIGSGVIKRWSSSPISATTITLAFEDTSDISAANLIAYPPESTTRLVRSVEKDDSGTAYASNASLVMVRFNAWMKANFSGGEDWVTPPGFLSHLYVREGAR